VDYERLAWKVAAAGFALLAVAVAGIGIAGEVAASGAREPALEPGVIVGGGLLVAAVLGVASYLSWPKR
jgi:hypothetical protein